jgi:hypothetical protein
LRNIFLTIPDKLFSITPNLYKHAGFEVRPAELDFKGFPEAVAGRGRWCAIQVRNSLGSDNRGQEESYRRPLEVVQIYRVLLIEKRNLKDFQLMSV